MQTLTLTFLLAHTYIFVTNVTIPKGAGAAALPQMAREATLVEEVDCSSTNVQRPLEHVEHWVTSAAPGGFIR